MARRHLGAAVAAFVLAQLAAGAAGAPACTQAAACGSGASGCKASDTVLDSAFPYLLSASCNGMGARLCGVGGEGWRVQLQQRGGAPGAPPRSLSSRPPPPPARAQTARSGLAELLPGLLGGPQLRRVAVQPERRPQLRPVPERWRDQRRLPKQRAAWVG